MSLAYQQPPLARVGVHDAPMSRVFAAYMRSATFWLLLLAPAAASVSAGAADGAAQTGHGQGLYTANCSACHQANGEGLPGVFPPLKGSGAVNNPDPTHQIHAVLFGAEGLTIGGVKYPNSMPPFPQLSDQDVADLVDYVRSAWGNHGRPINVAEVTAARARGP
jgi:cytochrome c oxidase cbb3-type subunit 2